MGTARRVERRRFGRLNERIFIRYWLAQRAGATVYESFAGNISAGGLCFECERSMRTDTHLALELYQPLKGAAGRFLCIAARGQVRWAARNDTRPIYKGANNYLAGVEFVQIRRDERKQVATYVHDRLRGRAYFFGRSVKQ